MVDQWTEIADVIQSSDPEQVNEAIDQIKQMNADERARLFDVGFDELRTIYADSDDGYVRQSAVRVIEQLTPGMVATFLIEDEDRLNDETGEGLQQRIDAICGFLLETIEDEDGRVRQSTKRGLKDVYRSYDALEDDDTIATLATELDDRATQSSGKQREHLLDTKEDAEFFLQSDEARLMQGLQRLSERSNDTQSSSRAESDRRNSHAFGLQSPSMELPEPLESVLPDTAVPIHELRALEERVQAYGEEIGFPIIGPEVGGWLQLLARVVDARRIFEFGSGFGYSAYWFARALPSDGEIVLTEVDADELEMAQEYLDRGDLGKYAVFEHGDALETVGEYDGPFEIVLIDVLKHEYEAAFEAVREKVAPGGIIVADNMMMATDIEFDTVVRSVEEDAAAVETNKQTQGIIDYLARVRADPQFETGILPLGNGVAVSYRTEQETNSSG